MSCESVLCNGLKGRANGGGISALCLHVHSSIECNNVMLSLHNHRDCACVCVGVHVCE